MRREDLQAFILDGNNWDYLSSGDYNDVFLSKQAIQIDGFAHEAQWVLKVPKSFDDELAGIQEEAKGEEGEAEIIFNDAERAVRKWNALNPRYPAIQVENRWIAPYVGNTTASDEEVATKLVEIYRETGNLVLDLFGQENCLSYCGEVICIDVDLALRRGSFTTDRFYTRLEGDDEFAEHYKQLFAYHSYEMPLTVAHAKNIMYLDRQLRWAELRTEWMTPEIISQLRPFRAANATLTPAMLELLQQLDTPETTNVERALAILPQVENPKLILEWCLAAIAQSGPITPEQLEGLKAQIRRLGDELNTRGSCGYNLLHRAVRYNRSDLVQFLMDLGADVNVSVQHNAGRYAGKKTIEIATLENNRDLVTMLLTARSEIRTVGDGKTRLMHFPVTTQEQDDVEASPTSPQNP